MTNAADILFEEITGVGGNLGLITLNRPQVLNALSLNMITSMYAKLTEWDSAAQIKAVVIRAEGRAFCAGGDIRLAYEIGRAGADNPEFFDVEYKLNRFIYNFSKPFIALMNGLTMGGGAGISITGSHRVVTRNFSFAMPETGIGFYPDVGMGYFLARMPCKIGFYLGLSGVRITAEDCLALQLVDAMVAPESLEKIIAKLADTKLQNEVEVNEVINSFALPVGKSELLDHEAEIQTCFSKNTFEEIFNALEHYPTPWCEVVAASINTKSPTSLKVTLRQLQTYGRLQFNECIEFDLRLTRQFLLGHDFYEGIRAAIIDKDQSPNWSPTKMNEVSAAVVEKYFL
ncbi:MAG: enoyl-CoA hydratase/isomerase family protein [Pseudomonadota bacterium]